MKILIVEDSSNISRQHEISLEEIFQEDLNLSKPDIKIVTTEEDAVREMNENNYDLATLDNSLANGGKGVIVLKKIPKEYFSKIISISTDETLFDYYRSQGVLVLDKNNADHDHLLPLVKKILGLK